MYGIKAIMKWNPYKQGSAKTRDEIIDSTTQINNA